MKVSDSSFTEGAPLPHSAVVGLQFGDEGKGQIVDLLSGEHDVIVRYNGGANAGHSVRVGNHKYVLHQLPVGILRPETINVMATGMVVTPDDLFEELDGLDALTTERGQLHISRRAHVVMPYHVDEDRLRAGLAESILSEEETLGTTNRGIGPCYADKAQRDTAVRVGDLFDRSSLARRLEFVVALKNAQLSALAEASNGKFTPYQVADLLILCEGWAERLEPYVTDTETLLHDLMADKSLLFEGANACLLDVDQGTYPFVTSSQTTVSGIPGGIGSPVIPGRRYGVAKTYISRVGTGPFVTELFGDDADRIRDIGQEYGSTTGRPRRVGWLDLPLLQHGVRVNGTNALVLTGLGVLSQLPSIKICTGYTGPSGQPMDTLPTTIVEVQSLQPQFIEMTPDGQTSGGSGLADWIGELIQVIEAVCPVAAVCVGRSREDVVWLD